MEKPGAAVYLKEKFGVEGILRREEKWDAQKVQIPASRLSQSVLTEFHQILGQEHVSTQQEDRVFHAAGRSYKDLVRLRSLKLDQAPDVVLFPSQENEIVRIIEVCRKNRIALIPFGGGSNVVGSLEPQTGGHSAVAILNMMRFNRVIAIDELSTVATVEAGIYGPDLEKQLTEKGWTLGHFPQSFEFSTLGGWIAMRSSGQNSILYGGVERWVVSLRIVTPAGVIETLEIPREAAGPDLKQVLIGSEGIFGVIVSAKIRVTPQPKKQDYRMYAFPSFEEAMRATRALARSRVSVAMIRVSDGTETEAFFKLGAHPGLKSTLTNVFLKFRGLKVGQFSAVIVGAEGTDSLCTWVHSQVEGIFSQFAVTSLGAGPGRRWLKDRFFLPYLRDEFMDNGVLIETFETAAVWSKALPLHTGVRKKVQEVSAKQGAPAQIFAHLSHFYPEGVSIYFTVIAKQKKGQEIQQWDEIKKAVNDEIRAQGGAASHHHGIGTEHRGYCWSTELEKQLLSGMKQKLDSDQIFNPGKLL